MPVKVITLHNGITQNLYNNTGCFEYNTYSLEIDDNTNSLQFTIDSVNKQSLLCNDYYLFGTNSFLKLYNKILSGKYIYNYNERKYFSYQDQTWSTNSSNSIFLKLNYWFQV